MIETIAAANGWLNSYVWGWPMIVLLVGQPQTYEFNQPLAAAIVSIMWT
ncbi:MAG: hypothetical protein RLZZ53_1708 [Acidobacteriota bacterium]